jgi:hypothetical protein
MQQNGFLPYSLLPNFSICFLSNFIYRGADKSLARPDWKKQLRGRHFSSDADVTDVAETRLDGQLSELFLSGFRELEFGRRCLFLSWSG